MAEKVLFGLSNVYFALLTFDENNNPVYGTPHKHPGAVNLTLETNGSVTPFYADNIIYYQSASNQGYTGSMEFALFDEWFKINVLKEIKDADGVLIENANAKPAAVAMMYQVESDVNARLRVLYNVQVERGSETAATTGETTEPQTSTMNITVTPLPNSQDIKASTSDDTPQDVLNTWFTQVHLRNGTYAEDATLETLTLGALTLTPVFDAATTAYTAETTNATNTITAAASSSAATVSIMANGSPVQNGTAITWQDGTNNVVVTVTNGNMTQNYTITVTKS